MCLKLCLKGTLIYFVLVTLFNQYGCSNNKLKQVDESSIKMGVAMMLINEGYIKVSGGCIACLTGKIIFKPQNEVIEIEINNSGYYFHDDKQNNQPIKSFKIVLPTILVETFFMKLKTLLDTPQPCKYISKRSAIVEILLPFKSEIIDVELREADGKLAIDPLLDEIEKFVLDCVHS
jgi:hypothetical protein